MKLNKYILGAIVLGTTGMGLTSCSESFLDEEQINAYTNEYFKTQEGIDKLATGMYSALKFKCNYSWGYGLYNMGIDEYTDANNEVAAMNGYTSLNASEGTYIPQLWDNMYNRIGAANTLLTNIDNCYDKTLDSYNVRKGEAYFIRAFCYFDLVKIYGGVPLKLIPSEVVETYFTRASEEEVYAQIISDFENAYNFLPTKPAKTGRITKSAAAHFLAKAKLHRASELYAKWNAKYVDQDLKDVIRLSQEVIDAHPLCANFLDVFDYSEANGASESVSEIVLAAQFSNDETTWGRFGNQAHLAFPSVYQNMAGTNRDISGGREFCYLRTTNYTLDVFDRVNDSRFWKTFTTCYGANNDKGTPAYTKEQILSGAIPSVNYITMDKDGNILSQTGTADDMVQAYITPNEKGGVDTTYSKRFNAGEIGIRYIINDAGDTEYANMGVEGQVTRNGVMQKPHTFVRYFNGETQNWVTGHGNYGNYAQKSRFVANSKHRDGYRIAIASQFGTRDFILARSAEDVLMKAEAYARLKDYTNAVAELNKLRDRAAYVDGEARTVSKDGGQAYKNNPYIKDGGGGFSADGAIYTDENTYLESNKMTADPKTSTLSAMHLNDVSDITGSARDNVIFEALKATNGEMFSGDETYQKVMNFILNERTRELTGEYTRWEDLARCRQIEVRHKAFNDAGVRNQGTFDPSKHYYRPIPQHFLDAITNASGASLSAAEKEAMQNPGY